MGCPIYIENIQETSALRVSCRNGQQIIHSQNKKEKQPHTREKSTKKGLRSDHLSNVRSVLGDRRIRNLTPITQQAVQDFETIARHDNSYVFSGDYSQKVVGGMEFESTVHTLSSPTEGGKYISSVRLYVPHFGIINPNLIVFKTCLIDASNNTSNADIRSLTSWLTDNGKTLADIRGQWINWEVIFNATNVAGKNIQSVVVNTNTPAIWIDDMTIQGGTPTYLAFSPDVISWTDYQAFGAPRGGRKYVATNDGKPYRYGFQDQEEDPETGYVNYKYRNA